MQNDMTNWLLQNQKSMLINVNRYARLSPFFLNQHRFISLAHIVTLCKEKKDRANIPLIKTSALISVLLHGADTHIRTALI